MFVQVLVNPETSKLVIRPCQEDDRDAIRWCIAKADKRKSRQITCGLFTAKLYEMMGWEALYRYKLLGTRINYQGEQLYVFDLTSTEIYLPASKADPNDVFELVQQQLAVRKPGANRYSGVRDFSGSVYCSECGGRYGSKVYHSTDKYRRLVWRCNHKYDNGSRCSTPTLQEKDLQRFFIAALNQLGNERKEIKAAFDECKEAAFDTTALEQEKAQVKADLLISSDQVARMIQANAALALNQEEYNKQFNVVCKRYDDLNARLTELEQTIADKESHRAEMESFMATLMKQPDMITVFDPTVYHVLVERMMIGTDGHVVVRFRNGMEVDVLIDMEDHK